MRLRSGRLHCLQSAAISWNLLEGERGEISGQAGGYDCMELQLYVCKRRHICWASGDMCLNKYPPGVIQICFLVYPPVVSMVTVAELLALAEAVTVPAS